MSLARLISRASVVALAVALGAHLFAAASGAQSFQERASPQSLRPDLARALRSRTAGRPAAVATSRPHGHTPARQKSSLDARPASQVEGDGAANAGGDTANARRAARAVSRRKLDGDDAPRAGGKFSTPEKLTNAAPASIAARIPAGTSPSIVLNTSQLSAVSAAGTNEQFADTDGDLVADSRATFDAAGGSFDIAVGRGGARYSVYSATDDRGTFSTADDLPVGVLAVGLDTNGDFVRDFSQTYDLRRDFQLPSAVSVVAGRSNHYGREFVVVSSSGYYNSADPNDPANEPTAGVVLLVRSFSGDGFDPSLSRPLVRAGDGQLNNANSLALLPNGDLLVADFDSNELRVVRDTNADGLPDRLDPAPFYAFKYSTDSPLEVAANSRGVVFTHSAGNSAVLLALHDANADGRADAEEVVVEGLSIDNNLILHGLTVDREGTVYVVEDAAGAGDAARDGGNLGTPLIDAFPDPALNGTLRDGTLYAAADNAVSQALSGLSFGTDSALAPVATLTFANSASRQGAATRDGLATISGSNLTRGRAGASEAAASARGVVVTIEGRRARVLSFADTRVNVHVPAGAVVGANSIVVWVDGFATAAEDATVAHANPGLFTASGTGAGTAIALLSSGMRYTAGDFPARFDGSPTVVALFGTGWRNSVPVAATVGGRAAAVEFAGPTAFPGLDQINVRLPEGIAAGAHAVRLTTAGGATSRGDVTITIR